MSFVAHPHCPPHALPDLTTYHVTRRRLPADETTPVRLFRQLREYFSPCVLLESNDFEQARQTRSIIGVDPLLELRYDRGELWRTDYAAASERHAPVDRARVLEAFAEEVAAVRYTGAEVDVDGFFGFTGFDAYRFAEPELPAPGQHPDLPDLDYFHFRLLVVVDHFHEHLDVIEFVAEGQPALTDRLVDLLRQAPGEAQGFAAVGDETSDLTDAEYEELVRRGIAHCDRGDTFQVVLSREFRQAFRGDDFEVYRRLRRLNPSPYGFYFDFGRYRMLGASPEALLKVSEGRATMRPIAGTYGLTHDAATDDANAERLLADEKENAEHRMLVDLARNDLSRSCYPVRVDFLRRIERYSHLMHIVSQVSGQLERDRSGYEVYAECFPAGTLSGAPKFKAVELIYRYEGGPRGAYGGGLGWVSPRGGFDHCIVIRSAVVVGNELRFRAGAGIVSASDPASERREVGHKTDAVRRAIVLADRETGDRTRVADASPTATPVTAKPAA